MVLQPRHPEERVLRRWVRATFLGWILGVLLILVGAIVGDLLGAEGEGQTIVGIAMGAGVGYAQARMLRTWQLSTLHWTVASTVGMGVPFIVTDVLAVVWRDSTFTLGTLLLNVVIGGLLVGLLQQRALSSKSDNTAWWVPTCIAGWTLVALGLGLFSEVARVLPGRWLGAIVNIAAIASGGIVLGLITGGPLARILRR
jgi:hypothetical protein